MNYTDMVYNKKLFERIHQKKAALDSKMPLPADAVEKLNEDIRLRHTYHSNAIEGNTLTLQETKIVVELGIAIGGKPLAEHLEATGNARAFDKIMDLAKKPGALDHITILELHEIITKGLLEDSGKYRTQNVRIAGARKSPPGFLKIPKLMDGLLDGLAKMNVHPIINVTYFHHRFVEIHPFSDGNGRVARLLTNLLLMRSGYPAVVLQKEDGKKYYDSLAKADSGNLGPFINFIGKAVDESLTLYLGIFGGKNELLPLAELSKISPYSQEYLSLRARQGILDAIKLENIWHSSKRALDEYVKERGK